MNKQEIFTKVKNHLLTQMEKSIIDITCQYRGPFGLMCAVGCLIPDKLYNPEMENIAYSYAFIDEFPEVGKLFDEGTTGFLRELQIIHDDSDVAEWASRLQKFAFKENLEF